MKRDRKGGQNRDPGPSQRQLRAGELVRHALVEILLEEPPHDLETAHITVTEVRMSPDLKHAICFVELLGAGLDAQSGPVQAGAAVEALNRHAKFLRGRLGRHIEMKFTPDLKFIHDESFEAAARMTALLARPEIRRDVEADLDNAPKSDGD